MFCKKKKRSEEDYEGEEEEEKIEPKKRGRRIFGFALNDPYEKRRNSLC